MGSALSPNGLAFSTEGMLSLALMDRVLDVDEKTQQVTVQAGARVQEVRGPLVVMLKAASTQQPACNMSDLESGAGYRMRRNCSA